MAVAWASCQIRKIASCACAGNAGNVFPRRRIQRKPRVSDPGMQHGTCVKHVPWRMSGLLTRGGRDTFLAFPAHAHPQFWRIWQEAHCQVCWHRRRKFVDVIKVFPVQYENATDLFYNQASNRASNEKLPQFLIFRHYLVRLILARSICVRVTWIYWQD